tara:strand:+ start:45339 stop:46247 length:909 start_codon:yes stop_codon:yes gene_type:complete
MSAALACMDWELRGVCVWMTCATIFCSFDVSTKVANFVPELTIQAYNFGEDEPWGETEQANAVLQAEPDSSFLQTLIASVESFDLSSFFGLHGGFTSPAHKGQHANLHHRAVDAYGNPAITAYMAVAEVAFGLVCYADTTPFLPFYVSNLDAVSWRWGVPEILYPQGLGFGLYDLGSLSNNYGPIYPRTSMTTQQDTFKTSVLGVYRVAHIVTRSSQGHIYRSLTTQSEDGYWPPSPLTENNASTGVFQMLYPDVESNCMEFPYGGEPGAGKRDSKTQYVWNFWRKHKCCQRAGDSLIFHTG